MLLFFIYFIFFILISAKLSLETVLFGLALSGLALLFSCKVLGWDRSKDKALRLHMRDILRYAPKLFVEILKANRDVIKIILSPGKKVEPQLFSFDSHLETPIARTVLADSITITPGTITVGTDERFLTVHALDKSFAFSDGELGFQRDLMAAEGRKEGA